MQVHTLHTLYFPKLWLPIYSAIFSSVVFQCQSPSSPQEKSPPAVKGSGMRKTTGKSSTSYLLLEHSSVTVEGSSSSELLQLFPTVSSLLGPVTLCRMSHTHRGPQLAFQCGEQLHEIYALRH